MKATSTSQITHAKNGFIQNPANARGWVVPQNLDIDTAAVIGINADNSVAPGSLTKLLLTVKD